MSDIVCLLSCGQLAVDDASRQFSIVAGSDVRLFSFEDLLELELVKEGKSLTKTSGSSVMKRMVVGGILLGGAGLVAGAATSRKITESMLSGLYLKILVKDDTSPVYCIPFDLIAYGSEAKALAEAESMLAVLKVVLARQSDAKEASSAHVLITNQSSNSALPDQISKLHDLYQQGILNEVEFATAKARLLS